MLKKLFMLLPFAFAGSINCVMIKNETSKVIEISDVNFISGIEIAIYPFTIKPKEVRIFDDYSSFDARIVRSEEVYELKNLTDDTVVLFSEVDNKIAVKVELEIKPVKKIKLIEDFSA